MDWTTWLELVIKAFVVIFILLTGFAYLTLYERRALARIQVRVGPNRAGPQGLLQPIADAVATLLTDKAAAARQIADFDEAMRRLGQGAAQPSLRAARSILDFVRPPE